MQTTRLQIAFALALALGLHSQSARAEQYDPPLNIGTIGCPAGSTGYGNARFIVFPSWGSAPPNWRLTIWCSAGGGGRAPPVEHARGGVGGRLGGPAPAPVSVPGSRLPSQRRINPGKSRKILSA